MKKITIVLTLFCISLSAIAQHSFWKKPNYGLTLSMNLPAIKSVQKDTVSMKSEWGTSIFFEFGNKRSWAFQTALGFDRVKYNHNQDHVTTLNSSINADLLAFFSPPGMEGTRFFAGIEPTYTLARKAEFLDGSSGSGIIQERIDIDYPFDFGLKAGISFDFKPHIALNLSYMEMFYGQPWSNGYDGLPDQWEVGLQITFNKMKSVAGINYKQLSRAETRRLKDSSLMLFVLESRIGDLEKKADEEEKMDFQAKVTEAIKYQIEAIENQYTFSEYVICLDTNMTDVLAGNYTGKIIASSSAGMLALNGSSGLFVARVGDFVLVSNQSTRLGVFIYDHSMNLYHPPFPHFTSYVGLEYYMNDPKKLNAMFMDLNERLMLLYTAR